MRVRRRPPVYDAVQEGTNWVVTNLSTKEKKIFTSKEFRLQFEPLYFGMQNGEPYVWALVLPDADKFVSKMFQIFGTGHDIPLSAKYIATTFDDPFVWHLFEVTDG